jgi:hypothetical protein
MWYEICLLQVSSLEDSSVNFLAFLSIIFCSCVLYTCVLLLFAAPNQVRYFVQEAAGGFVYLALELCSMTLQDAIQRICRHRAPTRASAANAASATDANVLLSSIGLGSDAPAASSAVDPHSNAFANAAAGVDRSWVHLPPQDRAAALGALQEICDGVAYLHKQRIVHRDLKVSHDVSSYIVFLIAHLYGLHQSHRMICIKLSCIEIVVYAHLTITLF